MKTTKQIKAGDKITAEQAIQIEQKHNVYVDAITMQFNHDGYDAVYGWDAVPQEWIDELG